MEMKDLRTGMIVEFRNGDKRLVMLQKGKINLCGIYCWCNMDNYRINLTHIKDKKADIVKVYLPQENYIIVDMLGVKTTLEKIWERKEIDWENVKMDTRVIIRSQSGVKHRRHFFKCEGDDIYIFNNGRTSFTAIGGECFIMDKNDTIELAE